MRGVRFILASCCAATVFAAPRPVDFNREVRPILSDKCFQCHGPDEKSRKAGLRLDLKDAALAKVIAPGSSAQSKLFQRVSHEKKALRMPPATSGIALSDKEVALLQRWIDEGAKWETHWSYTPPKRVEPPPARLPAWSKNPIDQFLLARLDREGLKPSAEADRATLLRRVTFDLTGLPPSLAGIDAFLKDKAPGACGRQVDRLLASPQRAHGDAVISRDTPIRTATISTPTATCGRGALRSPPQSQPAVRSVHRLATAGDLLPNPTREQLSPPASTAIT